MKTILALFFCPAAVASFLISEVYGNAPGRSKDDKKEWIELVNLSEPIKVKSVKLEIFFREKGETLSFSKEIELKTPVEFSNFLIIAQSLDLDVRASVEAPTIILPFSLKNIGLKTICIYLNEQKSCANFEQPLPDGTSLYRDINDKSSNPLWRHEPCQFLPGIFSSPGQSPGYFCKAKSREPQTFSPIKETKIMTVCGAKKSSKKICHIMYRFVGDMPKKSLVFADETFVQYQFQRTPIYNDSKKWPDLRVLKDIELILKPWQTPLNFSIKDEDGLLLYQQAFINPGLKKIKFPAHGKKMVAILSNNHEVHSLPLVSDAKTH